MCPNAGHGVITSNCGQGWWQWAPEIGFWSDSLLYDWGQIMGYRISSLTSWYWDESRPWFCVIQIPHAHRHHCFCWHPVLLTDLKLSVPKFTPEMWQSHGFHGWLGPEAHVRDPPLLLTQAGSLLWDTQHIYLTRGFRSPRSQGGQTGSSRGSGKGLAESGFCDHCSSPLKVM